jgi:hypothetical protein
MLALLWALPFPAFLFLVNASWALLITAMILRLRRVEAIAFPGAALAASLRTFLGDNRGTLWRSGGYAAGEFYLYNYPFALVPAFYGLGAPTIILDTAFKIFRGATILFSAACDLLVPRQTRAFAERDGPALLRATAIAAALGGVPAAGLCGVLLLAGDRLFSLLLGPAAVMPHAIVPILVVLVLANLAQTVANFLLVHTGFFGEIARAAALEAAAMTLAAAATAAFGFSLLDFFELYTVVYVAGALGYTALALWRPIRLRVPGAAGSLR